ncbi:Retrovirus-related Pol poly from transposon [Paramuricea clavata]|uniref:Retrovirus-related Pol poly from transposon n=1 Tax=Paramuricea clavata TaxID=317549 RepID=A0A6S7FZQ3_PARCT|nr:Retrovirus-related Pol poly from transposon [Paramuricea clavata]
MNSDNGPQYDSDEFQTFAKSFCFKQTRTSPHYSQSNCKAESEVKQSIRILQMTRDRESGTDYYLALLNIRNTPQEGHKSSPAQRMMNQRTRTTLPTSKNLLKPGVAGNIGTNIAKKQVKQQRYYNRGAKTLEQLHEGDRVKVQGTQELEVEEDAYLSMPDYGRTRRSTTKERRNTTSNLRELPAEPEGDQEYRVRSGRVSKRPVTFGELAVQ